MRLSPKVRSPPAGRVTSLITTQPHYERPGVGEHVGGVGDQGERVGEDADRTSTAMKPTISASAIASLLAGRRSR